MRAYLVVVDETNEARVALLYAARRAARTGGTVELLAVIPPAAFADWGGGQRGGGDGVPLRAAPRGDRAARWGGPPSARPPRPASGAAFRRRGRKRPSFAPKPRCWKRPAPLPRKRASSRVSWSAKGRRRKRSPTC